jgi:transposase
VSKARLVITAVVVEGRTQAQAARTYGVSKGWVSKLLARYRLEGEAAFEPRSRRPKTSPRATAPEVVALVVRLRKELSDHGLDAGPRTIGWHLEHHHGIRVSVATIGRQLAAQGLVEPEPKKRPKAVVPAVRGRAAQRDLAGRLHPLPAGRRPRRRGLVLAR